MSKLPKGEALRLCKDTTDINVIIDLTHHPDGMVRQKALRVLCPCRVKAVVHMDNFWKRVFEMKDDVNDLVRYWVLHTMCDGSPVYLEEQVAECLEHFINDPDKKIRGQANRALTSYKSTGKWNIL